MRSLRCVAVTATAILSSLLTACGNNVPAATPPNVAAGGPKVVASTSWVGAFAKAAGATDITVIAPANLQHPPDYDPKPGDLVAVARADYVLYAEFDGFASRLRDSAGGNAKLVPVKVENTPAAINAEVTRLADLFGTTTAAASWLKGFENRYAELSNQVKAKALGKPLVAVAQLFMAYWGDFAGVTVSATYGPQPVTPAQLAGLVALKPVLVLANAHLPGANPDIAGARKVDLINYPAADLDLLAVFRINADRLTAALAA
jgi:zinc transport system substrate-binding protein